MLCDVNIKTYLGRKMPISFSQGSNHSSRRNKMKVFHPFFNPAGSTMRKCICHLYLLFFFILLFTKLGIKITEMFHLYEIIKKIK